MPRLALCPLAAVAALVLACGPAEGTSAPVCDPGSNRCAGALVEVCDDAGQWRLFADCGRLGSALFCVVDPVCGRAVGGPAACCASL